MAGDRGVGGGVELQILRVGGVGGGAGGGAVGGVVAVRHCEIVLCVEVQRCWP